MNTRTPDDSASGFHDLRTAELDGMIASLQLTKAGSPCPPRERRVRSVAAAVPTSWTWLTFCIHLDSITSGAERVVAGGWCPRAQTNQLRASC